MLRKNLIVLCLAAVAVCGPIDESGRNGRIVGGRPAVEGQFPYQAALLNRIFFFCGASIINEHWVISAAHCTTTTSASNINILAGSILLSDNNRVIRSVSRVIDHPQYERFSLLNDISLLEVREPFVWTPKIQPIKLGSEFVKAGVSVVISGWGETVTNGDFENHLQWLTKTTISNEECLKRFGPRNERYIVPNKVCTFNKVNEGICQGDSGGPVAANGYLIGVVSFNVRCAVGAPDGHERISHFLGWINQNIST